MDLTAYLCPDPWKAPGIQVEGPRTALSVTRDEDLGQQTVEAYILPDGPPGDRVSITALLCPINGDELACLLCRPSQEAGGGETADRLLRMLNDQREAFSRTECKGCSPLEWGPRVFRAARAEVYARAAGQDPLDPRLYLQQQGVSFLFAGSINGFIPKSSGIAVEKGDLEALVASWMAQPHTRGRILHPQYERAAAAFWWSTNPGGWFVVVTFADGGAQSDIPAQFEGSPPPQLWACEFSCVQTLQYFRRKISEKFQGEETEADYITFRWQNPPLCNLWKVELVGDVRGTRAVWVCPTQGSAGCSGDIPPVKSEVPILGGREMEFDMIDIPPFPGEFFQVLGHLHGVGGDDQCDPIIIACGYFRHFCHTSGKITAILLYENDQVVDERTSGCTPEGWIGDTRLAYRVRCEGEELVVVPSDFKDYCVGDRVVIQKGGVHTIHTLGGDIREAGCQDPDGATEFDLLRWDLVRPFPIYADGVICPQKFWGI